MKAKKIEKKLHINKLTITNLDDIRGGKEANVVADRTIVPLRTRYEYTCPGWTNCYNGYAC
jgi:hypothetical protein